MVCSATGAGSGPGGRTRTCTGRGLSSLPLHWATPGKMVWLMVEMVLPVGIAPTTLRFEAGRSYSAELRELM